MLVDTITNINPSRLAFLNRTAARVRYRHKPAKRLAVMEEGGLSVTFFERQRAITPGQSVVIYKGDVVLCGGIIKEVYFN